MGRYILGGTRSRAFLGIPFAEPPTGELRFEPPQPYSRAWGGVNADGTSHGWPRPSWLPSPACPQPGFQRTSEDCLRLDVYVPSAKRVQQAKKPLAVLFWIYGGAFSLGSSRFYENYNAKFLVDHFDIIVVSANYRVGPFGFLAARGKGGQIHGNAGILDQIAAMKWVRRNIRRFGGDPDNVTLSGGSAGATSITIHLTSDNTSKQLFKRAMMQSAPLAIYMRTVREAESVGHTFARNMSCIADEQVDLSCLKRVPFKTITKATKEFMTAGKGVKPVTDAFWWWPHIDGTIVKQNPFQAILQGSFKRVPLIMGTTRDETGLFTFLDFSHVPFLSALLGKDKIYERPNMEKLMQLYFGKHAPRVSQYYPLSDTKSANEEMYVRLSTDLLFVCPLMKIADKLSQSTHVYAYQLNKTAKMFMGLFGDCGGKKICHGSEVPFVWRSPIFLLSASERKLSDTMLHHWVNFMHGHMDAEWAPFNRKVKNVLNFGDEVATSTNYRAKFCNLWSNELGYNW